MKQLILAMITLCCLSSCSENLNKIELGGNEWSLLEISCKCAPVYLEKGEHQWKFDQDKDQVQIISTIQLHPERLLPSGTYAARVEEDLVTIDGTQYQATIDGDNLILDSNYPDLVDAPILTFVKM